MAQVFAICETPARTFACDKASISHTIANQDLSCWDTRYTTSAAGLVSAFGTSL
ncbi:hypothetical protein Fuma_00260 [Fuerstiella marisgermanici]|uniref:Uncharacterized protein n=1 Tax=Fuerstiella marisgermanici TaxID=1891926 RepID=A0A1P8W9F9_9PLAN|nr:hypothetical protein Fuma_00260 [Fuerstiella marisgermanici]